MFFPCANRACTQICLSPLPQTYGGGGLNPIRRRRPCRIAMMLMERARMLIRRGLGAWPEQHSTTKKHKKKIPDKALHPTRRAWQKKQAWRARTLQQQPPWPRRRGALPSRDGTAQRATSGCAPASRLPGRAGSYWVSSCRRYSHSHAQPSLNARGNLM